MKKKVYKLLIDKEFQQLIPPLQEKELEQLEKNILEYGCREPICVHKNTIIDGHNRYSICIKHQIPFFIEEIEFNSREEIIVWICANQLGRRNISLETRKYLIGKRYEAEKIVQSCKNINGHNQYSSLLPRAENGYKGRNKTPIRLGEVYNISHNTVKVYSKFAKSIDYLAENDAELCDEVMKGKVKLSTKDVNNILAHPNTKIKEIKQKSKEKEKKITIKDMPEFDPDAEIMSLAYTIPSWIDSVEHVLNKQDYNLVSENAKKKLKEALHNLKYTADTMILAMEVGNG